MFGITKKQFLVTWGLFLLALVVGGAAVSGSSSIDGSFDFFGGLASVADLFGGLVSFGALVLVLILVAVFFVGFFYVANKDYTGKRNLKIGHGVIAFAALAAAAVIGIGWIVLPTSWTPIWVLVGAFAVSFVLTFGVAKLFTK